MPMMLPERLRRPIEIFHAALLRKGSLELSARLAASSVSALISSSRIPGTMITARGRLRFSNRANLIALAYVYGMPISAMLSLSMANRCRPSDLLAWVAYPLWRYRRSGVLSVSMEDQLAPLQPHNQCAQISPCLLQQVLS